MNFDTNNHLGSIGPKNTNSKPTAGVNSKSAAPTVIDTQGKSEPNDQVVLSPKAQTFARLQSKIDASPEVNLDKVAEIKQAIAEGRFEINTDRIAENMLNQESLLG
jgi:negative regulator of flagellin synthesis FlgM